MKFWDRVKWDLRRLYYQLKKALIMWRIGEEWRDEDGLERRRYPDYETYMEHQKVKLGAFRAKFVARHDRRFYAALGERLAGLPLDFGGSSVVCLGARQGSEVRAFSDRGAFAVGIDLNPGPDNPHVLPADFHAVPFASVAVDYVYTNSLDHAFDLDRVLKEAVRILKPRGGLILEVNLDSDSGGARAGRYESTVWHDAGALLDRVRALGLESVREQPFEVPWSGRLYLMFRGGQWP